VTRPSAKMAVTSVRAGRMTLSAMFVDGLHAGPNSPDQQGESSLVAISDLAMAREPTARVVADRCERVRSARAVARLDD
jgi:hypothetical protein